VKFTTPTPEQAPFALRALKTVALASGELDPQERRFLEIACEVLGTPHDVDALAPISPEELAAAIEDPEVREALVQRMVVMAMMDGDIDRAEIAAVEAFARALAVSEPALRTMTLYVSNHHKLLAFDLARRSFAPERIKAIWREEGLAGLWKVVKAGLGATNPAMAARFHALAELPEGTLGRALFEFYRENGFTAPGEKYGPPDNILFHDLGHVLGGYPTDPSGEVRIAGFQAGYLGEGAFFMTQFIMLLFHLGANIRPGVTATRGMFDLDAFRREFLRGRQVKVNLLHWDPWPHMARPIAEVRAELGVPAPA